MADAPKDTSVDGLATSLEALLTGTTDETPTDESTETTEEAVEEESEEEAEEESEEGESEEEEGEEEEAEAPKIVSGDTVVFTELDENGKEIPVTAEEAKAGRLRMADYTRKTQEAAEERKATQAERVKLSDALATVLTAMDGSDADATPEKLAELARTDPEKALQMRFEKEARDEQRKQIEKARAALVEQTQKEQQAEAEAAQKVEFAKLVAVYPDLADPVKATPILTRMTEAAVAAGFSAEDMNRITDHRLMKLLDLAATGLRLSKKAPPKPEPKGKKGPVITPGVRPINSGRKAAAEAGEKFKQDRSVDSAVDALAAAMRAAKRK